MLRPRILSPALGLAVLLTGQLALAPAAAAAPLRLAQQAVPTQEPQPLTADQLDNLVAPIALYADPLLAQVLLAATFPDQIASAAQYVRANGTAGVDDQYWDVSVKAVAHYPTVLNMMDEQMDWTTALGQAYAAQSSDVMQAVQHMRQLAQGQGNLVTTPEQQVVYNDGYISIWPSQPRVIYVPVYDPAVVYVRPIFYRPGFQAFFSFGVPFPIGAWLIYDWDWPAHRIYYTGWNGGGWIARSRPYIRITNVYVNPGYRDVRYDRRVLDRRVDYARIRRYDALHRGVNYDNRGGGRYAVPRDGGRDVARAGNGNTGRYAVPRAGRAPAAAPAPSQRRGGAVTNGSSQRRGNAQGAEARAPRRNGSGEAARRPNGANRSSSGSAWQVMPQRPSDPGTVRRALPVQPGRDVPRWNPPAGTTSRTPTVTPRTAAPSSAPAPGNRSRAPVVTPRTETPRWNPPARTTTRAPAAAPRRESTRTYAPARVEARSRSAGSRPAAASRQGSGGRSAPAASGRARGGSSGQAHSRSGGRGRR